MRNQRAFTVVELLVVITIILVVIAAVVPQLRVINKDRKLREAAQIFVSALERASRKAKLDGASALILERNPRFTRSYPAGHRGFGGEQINVGYGVTRIYVAAAVPDYRDDFGGSVHVYLNSTDVNIPVGSVVMSRPLAHDESNGRFVVTPGDTLRAGGTEREILTVQEYVPTSAYSEYPNGMLILTVSPAFPLSTPDGTPINTIGEYDEYSNYVVQRQPRLDNSNFFEIPAGHMIDLRFSGPPMVSDGTVDNFFMQHHCTDDDYVRLNFNEEGLITSVDTGDGIDTTTSSTPGTAVESTAVFTNVQFLVCDDGLDLGATEDQLMFNRNLWVVASPVSGRISVTPIVANTTGVPATDKAEYMAQVWNAQALIRQSQLANQ